MKVLSPGLYRYTTDSWDFDFLILGSPTDDGYYPWYITNARKLLNDSVESTKELPSSCDVAVCAELLELIPIADIHSLYPELLI